MKQVAKKSPTKVTTKAGTVIERWRIAGVGKLISSRLYVHRDYVDIVLSHIPAAIRQRYREALVLYGRAGSPPWNVVRIGLNDGTIMLAISEDFDTAREPHVGQVFSLAPDDSTSHATCVNIWHHKWLFVQDDYAGFDVKASVAWSKRYAALLNEPPLGKDTAWLKQLESVGLA